MALLFDADFAKEYDPWDPEYFELHPEDIPEGCQTCGGDYPNCASYCYSEDD